MLETSFMNLHFATLFKGGKIQKRADLDDASGRSSR